MSYPTSIPQTNPLVNPSQEEAIGNIVHDFNRQRFVSSSLGNIPTRNTNPFLADPVQTHNLITTPTTGTGQNTLPLTLPTQTVTQTNSDSTSTSSQEALAKALDSSKSSSHKMNYGRVPPPILSLDNELRSSSYQI